jgi:hypothetical protein
LTLKIVILGHTDSDISPNKLLNFWQFFPHSLPHIKHTAGFICNAYNVVTSASSVTLNITSSKCYSIHISYTFPCSKFSHTFFQYPIPQIQNIRVLYSSKLTHFKIPPNKSHINSGYCNFFPL